MESPPTQPQQRPRAAFLVADVARITGGKIVKVHHNACPNLLDPPGRCTCAAVDWRLVAGRAF